MRAPRPCGDDRRGSALVLALITAAVVAALVVAMFSASMRDAAATGGTIEHQRALLTARAGMWAMANYLSQGGEGDLPNPGDVTAIAGDATTAAYAKQTQADQDGDGTATPLVDGDGDGQLDFSHRGAISGKATWFEVRARRESPTVVRVVARGIDRGSLRTIEAWLGRQQAPGATPFQRAVFSDRDLLLKADVYTDSYDPVLVGPYASHVKYQAFDDNGDPAQLNGNPVFLASTTGLPGGARGEVASNGGITLQAGAFAYGDARPGPGKSVDLGGSGNSHVEGVTTPMTQPITYPPPDVTPPASPANAAFALPAPGLPWVVSGPAAELDLRGQGNVQLSFSEMQLGSNSSLTIRGDPGQVIEIYLTSGDERSLRLNNDAHLYLSPTGQANGPILKLLTNGGVEVNAASSLNPTGDPVQLQLYSSFTDPTRGIRLNSRATSQAAFYAPGAAITFNADFEFFGAVVGGSVTFNNKILFHYDESLGSVTSGPPGPTLWVPRATREVR